MDSKLWYQSRTIWAALVSALAGLAAVTGHNVDAGTQTQLVGALTNVADAVAIISSVTAAYYRTQAQTAIEPKPATPVDAPKG